MYHRELGSVLCGDLEGREALEEEGISLHTLICIQIALHESQTCQCKGACITQ